MFKVRYSYGKVGNDNMIDAFPTCLLSEQATITTMQT